MHRYYRADMYRLWTRIPRYIAVAISFAIMFLILFFMAKDQTIYQIITLLTKCITYVCPLLGLIEYIFVFGDDFKAKTMQIAIGTGVKRRHVILAKWLEVIVLCTVDYVILFGIILMTCGMRGIKLDAEPVIDIVILLFWGLVKTTGCIGMAMILVFAFNTTSMGMLLYLAALIGIPGLIISIPLDSKALIKLGLSKYLLENLEKTATSRMLVGTYSYGYYVGILIYFALFYIAACLLFKKKELEF